MGIYLDEEDPAKPPICNHIFAGGTYNGTRIRVPKETPYQPPANATTPFDAVGGVRNNLTVGIAMNDSMWERAA